MSLLFYFKKEIKNIGRVAPGKRIPVYVKYYFTFPISRRNQEFV